MDEKDKTIQDLRHRNEALKSKVRMLEEIIAGSQDFYTWLQTEAFGEEQFLQILNQYKEDRKLS